MAAPKEKEVQWRFRRRLERRIGRVRHLESSNVEEVWEEVWEEFGKSLRRVK